MNQTSLASACTVFSAPPPQSSPCSPRPRGGGGGVEPAIWHRCLGGVSTTAGGA